MQTTKKQKGAIILNFIVYSVLLIGSVFALVYYIIPNITEIEQIKQKTLETYNKIQETKKKGVGFGIFSKNVNTGNLKNISQSLKDYTFEYLKGIVEDVDKNFFEDNFVNNTEKNYESFLNDLKQKYEGNETLEEKLAMISRILPSYSEKIYEIDEENSLTDFRFINYIESLIYTFNFVYSDSIGIESVDLLPEYKISSSDSSLDRNIYYIDMDLELEGRKQSILEFIYFMQSVGKVYVDEQGELQLFNEKDNTDKYFSNFEIKKLSYNTDSGSDDYNIFNNQLAEVKQITFSDDIDSNFDFTNSLEKEDISLIQHLKNTNQMNEKFSAKISLKFYVKGLPKYKVEKFINDFKSNYDELGKEITELLKNNKINYIDRKKLEGMKITLNELSETVDFLVKNEDKKEMTDIYNESYKYNSFLQENEKEILKIKEKLEEKKVKKTEGTGTGELIEEGDLVEDTEENIEIESLNKEEINLQNTGSLESETGSIDM